MLNNTQTGNINYDRPDLGHNRYFLKEFLRKKAALLLSQNQYFQKGLIFWKIEGYSFACLLTS